MTENTLNTTEEKVKRFLNLLRSSKRGKNDYQTMLGMLTPEVIIEMASHPRKWISLCKIPDKLHFEDALNFCLKVYSVHDRIPKLELLKLWCSCQVFSSYSPLKASKICQLYYPDFINEPAANLLPDRKLHFLIDREDVRAWFAEKNLEGWKLFRHTVEHGRNWRTVPITPQMENTLRSDEAPMFAVFKDMTGQKMSFSLLMLILKHNAGNILQFLLDNGMIPEDVITFPELCVLITTQFKEHEAIALLKVLEAHKPGCLKDFRDPFGRNLLWYVAYNANTVWFHPRCRLVPFLLEQGCDPDNCNRIGFSWRYVSQNMPLETKRLYLKKHGWRIFRAFPERELSAAIPDSKEARKIVSQWTETAVISSNFGLPKLKKLTRSRSREPLYLEIRKELADLLAETARGFPYFPEEILPESWKEGISERGTFHVLDKPLSAQDRSIMASCHHPLSGAVPGGSYGTELGSIPQKKKWEKIQYTDDKEKALAILKTGLLVYHPWVRDYYCRQKYPGYRILRYLGWDKSLRYLLREKYLPLIKEDNLPEFALLYGMDSGAGSPDMLYDILSNNAVSIRDWLLDEREDFLAEMPPAELLFFGVANLDGNQAVRLIDAVEARWPETAVHAHDCFGSNLLWYNYWGLDRGLDSKKNDQVQKRLQKAGCRMVEQNLFGLAPQDIELKNISK